MAREVVVICTPVGVTEFDATEAGPVPDPFTAATVNVYAVPTVKPVIVVDVPVPDTDSPVHPAQAGELTIVYPVIGPPPVLIGAVQESVTVGPETVATGLVGAPGNEIPDVLAVTIPPKAPKHTDAEGQAIPPPVIPPVAEITDGKVEMFQAEPPLAVSSTKPWPDTDPDAKQTDTEVQVTLFKVPEVAPVGTVWAVQVPPVLTVVMIAAAPRVDAPVAKQTVVDGQEIESTEVTPRGRLPVASDQLAPLVVSMIDAEAPEMPVAKHCVAEEQNMELIDVTPAGTPWALQEVPPFTELIIDGPVPTAKQVVVVGQDTASRLVTPPGTP